jgi:hypothetical protein
LKWTRGVHCCVSRLFLERTERLTNSFAARVIKLEGLTPDVNDNDS